MSSDIPRHKKISFPRGKCSHSMTEVYKNDKEDKRQIAVIDAETDPFRRLRHPMPFLWGFYDGERYRDDFKNVDELFAFLRPQKLRVYAHNGGKFDYQYILNFLEPYSEVLIINGRLAKFMIGECEFRDSWNILPEKLAKFKIDGQSKHEIDYAKLEASERHKHMPEIKRYLQQDCKVLYKAVKAFNDEYGSSITLAGAAMKFYKNMDDSEVPNSDPYFYDFCKDFYYGGRVQCFRAGEVNEPFHFTDINSAYPYAMLHDHPISTSFKMVKNPSKDEPVIPQSLYHVRCVSKGGLPYRKDEKTPLEFPNDGKWREHCISGWELQAAIDTKTINIIKIISRSDFGKFINFKSYVDYFYEKKKNAEKGSTDYIFAKLFLNSLYGKWASNPENYCNYGLVPTDSIEGTEKDSSIQLGRHKGPWSFAGLLGPWAVMAGKNPDNGENNPTHSKYFNVATAASITGFVRSYLWRHICAVRAGGGTMLYCDTDSLAFTYPPSKPLPFVFSDELGMWGDEAKGGQFIRGGIAGKKLYAFCKVKDGVEEWKTASKGVKLGWQEIMEIAKGSTLTYLNPVPTFSPFAVKKHINEPKKSRFIHRTVRMTAKTETGS